MRRPAQHHPTTAWSHPYTGPDRLAVFYNDGGNDDPQNPPVPSPADLAQRGNQGQPPAPQPPAAPQYVLDRETGEPLTQDQFTRIMTRESAKGRNKALRPLFESVGLDFDHANPDTEKLAQLLKDAETTRQAQLSDDQRRGEEFDRRQQELAAREEQIKAKEAEAARRDRDTRIRSTLVSLGATGDDLDDAARLLAVPDDATDEQILEAATQLKERRSVLFGGPAAPQTLPAAPSGGPAAGNLPQQPNPGKNALQDAARQRAIDMGLRTAS